MSATDIAKLIEGIDEEALAVVTQCLEAGEDPVDLLKNGVVEGLRLIGQKFEEQEYFLAELMLGGRLAENCIAAIDPYLPKDSSKKRGVVVIGAVKGDLHDLGYSIVAKQLKLAGFEVHEIGVDVEPMAFIDKAKQVGADIIGLSAFLITTFCCCRDVVNYVRDLNLDDDIKVIIGGSVTSQERADEIGADGWAGNAVEAVHLCERLISEKQRVVEPA